MRLLILILALVIERLVGEYPNRLHPVVWMGSAIGAAERRAPARGQLLYGALMALGLPSLFAGLGWAVMALPVVDVVVGALLLKACFAIRALGAAGEGVAVAAERGDLPGARLGLRSLCSRDPSALSMPELVAGATESIAENASDSVVAPMFWYAVAGLPGVLFYRTVNTMDAMIGYHGRYEWLGKAAARLDDLLNLIPARLTALSLLIGGALTGEDVRGGLRVMRRDAGKTESPNAGWPMAAMAGLLGVALEKPGCYRLGDSGGPLDADTIRRGWRVIRVASLLAIGGALVASGWVSFGGGG